MPQTYILTGSSPGSKGSLRPVSVLYSCMRYLSCSQRGCHLRVVTQPALLPCPGASRYICHDGGQDTPAAEHPAHVVVWCRLAAGADTGAAETRQAMGAARRRAPGEQ